jgi:hypothetical protein
MVSCFSAVKHDIHQSWCTGHIPAEIMEILNWLAFSGLEVEIDPGEKAL